MNDENHRSIVPGRFTKHSGPEPRKPGSNDAPEIMLWWKANWKLCEICETYILVDVIESSLKSAIFFMFDN